VNSLEIVVAHLKRASADPRDVDALEEAIGARLPADYRWFVHKHDGAEGWIGSAYIALWAVHEINRHNQTVDPQNYAPGLLLFGTDGGGEAFAFDTTQRWRVVRVPLVGLSRELAIEVGPTITDWLVALASDGSPPPTHTRDGQSPRMNIYEVQPILVGGTPTDSSNKAWVTLSDLLAIARWWNERLRDHTRSKT
jgi:hypothetical protein